ncbi:hypothetical protein S3E15_00258 [Bacillus mycoides]|uniref:Uncharacterized protein n=1 Tax=Bacillus mycoides TaxID=1405 RepID=A0AAP8BH16_BACMY|nr:hypothetical protein bmyco0001_27170 [Bacillus mycoides DSM 2048]KUH40960.1 hypothetical protein M2E15_4743 [Bacillus mycoides]KZE07716.1 hypothetical protein B4117_0869 [Bacillus mycoides]OSX88349.1 hypothetical protein BTJ44_04027 [Bacillus mycoides]OSX96627.1 hypothetical protein S3E15_00258 [Bacillus mycoides]
MEDGDKEDIQTFRGMERRKRRSFFTEYAPTRLGITKI